MERWRDGEIDGEMERLRDRAMESLRDGEMERRDRETKR